MSKELEKYREYYNAVLQWLVLKQNNIKIDDFLYSCNYKKIVIYGMGDMGNCFYMEIRNSKKVKFLYAIDQGFPKLYFDIPCYKLSELCDKEVPDLVVIMLPNLYNEIRVDVKKIVKCDTISITELVYRAMYQEDLC